ALDRRLADAAGGGDALAEADDAGKSVDDAEPLAGRAGDQQAAIVGAEVERRIGCARLALLGTVAPVPPILAATPAAARPPRPIPRRVEAAGPPALVFHFQNLPVAPGAPFGLDKSRHVFRQIGSEHNSVARARNMSDMSDQRPSTDWCACP